MGLRSQKVWNLLTLCAIAASLSICGSATANAQASTPTLSIDKVFARPSGWLVGENDSGGCLAVASYKDGTTVWIGFDRESESILAFTNENWGSITPGQAYELQMRARGQGNWRGQFTGFQRRGEKGFVARGLKTQFLRDFAAAGGIWVSVAGREMARLSLGGSNAALGTIIECQKQQIASRGDRQNAPAPSTAPVRAAPEPQRESSGSSGTGFFVSTNGHVMTNNHVVKDCQTISVGLAGGVKTTASLVARDATNDLALLRTNLKPVALPAFSTRPRIGESVYAFGFPLVGMLSTSGNFTIGNITATAGLADDTRHLQISTPVQVGNSGGPLLDQFGNVTGVIVSKLNVAAAAKVTGDIIQNVNFAIKSAIAVNFLDSNGIAPVETRKTQTLDPATIAEAARDFTVLVTCR